MPISTGALKTGLPPRISSRSTAPASRSFTSPGAKPPGPPGWLRWVGIEHRLAHVAERRVHGVGQGVNGGRLVFARDHQAGALVSQQVARDRAGPFVDVPVFAGLRALRRAQAVASAPANSSISAARSGSRWSALRARGRGHRLHHVQPVHVGLVAAHPAPRGELARIAQAARARRQKIRIERDDHVGLGEVVIAC